MHLTRILSVYHGFTYPPQCTTHVLSTIIHGHGDTLAIVLTGVVHIGVDLTKDLTREENHGVRVSNKHDLTVVRVSEEEEEDQANEDYFSITLLTIRIKQWIEKPETGNTKA